MPNIASILKAEIARVARKTVRVELQALKKSAGTHRSEVAALKKRITALELQLRRQDKAPRPGARSANAGATQAADAPSTIRFTAKGLASQRRRLDLSAEQLGQLVGASGQSVYNWQAGKARLPEQPSRRPWMVSTSRPAGCRAMWNNMKAPSRIDMSPHHVDL